MLQNGRNLCNIKINRTYRKKWEILEPRYHKAIWLYLVGVISFHLRIHVVTHIHLSRQSWTWCCSPLPLIPISLRYSCYIVWQLMRSLPPTARHYPHQRVVRARDFNQKPHRIALVLLPLPHHLAEQTKHGQGPRKARRPPLVHMTENLLWWSIGQCEPWKLAKLRPKWCPNMGSQPRL